MIHYCRNCTGLFDHDPVRYEIKCPFCRHTTVVWTRRQIAIEEAELLMAKNAEKEAKRKNKRSPGKKQKELPPVIPPAPDDKVKERITAVRPATKEEAKRARSDFYEPPDIVWEEESESFRTDWEYPRVLYHGTSDDQEDSAGCLNRTSLESHFPVDEDGLPIGDGEDFIGEDFTPFWNGDDGDFIDDDSSHFWTEDDGDFADDPNEFFSGDYESQIPFSRKQVKQEVKPWRRNPSSGKKRRTA